VWLLYLPCVGFRERGRSLTAKPNNNRQALKPTRGFRACFVLRTPLAPRGARGWGEWPSGSPRPLYAGERVCSTSMRLHRLPSPPGGEGSKSARRPTGGGAPRLLRQPPRARLPWGSASAAATRGPLPRGASMIVVMKSAATQRQIDHVIERIT